MNVATLIAAPGRAGGVRRQVRRRTGEGAGWWESCETLCITIRNDAIGLRGRREAHGVAQCRRSSQGPGRPFARTRGHWWMIASMKTALLCLFAALLAPSLALACSSDFNCSYGSKCIKG